MTDVRRFRPKQGVRSGQQVPADLNLTAARSDHEAAIRQLLRLDPPTAAFYPTATLPVGDSRISIDLSQAIDVEAEKRRPEKDLAGALKEIEAAEKKLNNDAFLAMRPTTSSLESAADTKPLRQQPNESAHRSPRCWDSRAARQPSSHARAVGRRLHTKEGIGIRAFVMLCVRQLLSHASKSSYRRILR
ncbi:hypothetical protein ACGFIX_19325 [Nocardia salmonicida]|uniref:hypothetical protein n=1 Tax=Nocardia salmonicida TaxID=53431 RepID=UPI00372466D2